LPLVSAARLAASEVFGSDLQQGRTAADRRHGDRRRSGASLARATTSWVFTLSPSAVALADRDASTDLDAVERVKVAT
jgi:hypothetical protein